MTAVTITAEQWAHGQESGVIWHTVDVVPDVEQPLALWTPGRWAMRLEVEGT